MANITFRDGTHDVEEVKVVSTSFDPDTLEAENGGSQRTEIIDVETNALFKGCESIWDIEDTYEAFWNRLNRLGGGPKPPSIVKVLKVSR